MKFNEHPDQDMLAIEVANEIAGDLKTHLLSHEGASFAVPGGTTPGLIFDALCAADIEWGRVHVMATDERWVPADNARSNARMIRARLLQNRAAAAQLLPFYVPEGQPEEVLAGLDAQVVQQLPLSVLLLGMGEDMHTASLFPGADGIEAALAADAPALIVMRPDCQPEARISLTARVLDSAIAKHLVIFGDAKRRALEQAMALPPETAPVQAVMSEVTVHWAP
ncbi:6-phosphogluconolactonase [Leisingera sp.]|uniref:6-phosphogluconolactonase n=1 Tax=Leisingera sp. TaxID=1879318 RepID=UPI002B27499C|nr:6-phosphogluconolactonase [Leisingera sp.]